MDKILSYSNIPEDIKYKMDQLIRSSTTAILGFDENNAFINGLLASGTFVEINGKYGLLTAKHVYSAFKEKATYMSFCILDIKHYVKEKIEYLRCYFPDNSSDICFIEIPTPILGTIKAVKIFHPILKDNFSEIEAIKNNVWITIGFPLEIQSIEDKHLMNFTYLTHLTKYSNVTDIWDEVELDIHTKKLKPDFPKSLGGMSGGGIWNFHGYYNEIDGKLNFFIKLDPKNALIAGVNFYQEFSQEEKVCKILGVGPRSIYQGMTKVVK